MYVCTFMYLIHNKMYDYTKNIYVCTYVNRELCQYLYYFYHLLHLQLILKIMANNSSLLTLHLAKMQNSQGHARDQQ